MVMYSHGGEAMKKAVSLGIAGVFGAVVCGLRDGLGWIPDTISPLWRISGNPVEQAHPQLLTPA